VSDSLFDAPETPAADPETPASATPETPAADLPWWEKAVPGKWKTEDDALKGYRESSREAREKADEAKALAEKATGLEARIGGLLGAPKGEDGKAVPYTFELPEGVTLDADHPLLGKLNEIGQTLDLAPSVLQPLVAAYLEHEAGTEHGRRENEAARLTKALGDDEKVAAEVKETFAWASGLLGEDAIDDLREAGSLAATILTLSRLRKAMTETGIGRGTAPDAGAGKAALESWLATPDHQRPAMPEAAAAYLNARNPEDPQP